MLILTGCMDQDSPVDKMYQVLEKVASVENGFEEQQEPLVELEKKEKELYNQIMALGLKQHEEVNKLADEAIPLVEKRQGHLQKETDSIKASEKEFEKVVAIKDDLKDSKQKKLAVELYETMMKRYKAHSQLSKGYLKALEKDKELYTMLKKESIAYEELENQIVTLNKSYQTVFKANEEFNKLTEQYNDKKLDFYKASGLKVKSEE